MRGDMAAVINDDVEGTVFVDYGLKEGGIALVADLDVNAMFRSVETPAILIDIDADDGRASAEKAPPQL